jgi:PAS domain S-box-containing protein
MQSNYERYSGPAGSVENSPLFGIPHYGLMAVDRLCQFIDWSSGAEALLGFEKSEVIGKTPFELFLPGEADMNNTAHYFGDMVSAKVRGEERRCSYTAIHKSGTPFPGEWYHDTLLDHDGSICGVACLLTNSDAATVDKNDLWRFTADYSYSIQQRVLAESRCRSTWLEIFSRRRMTGTGQATMQSLTARERALAQELVQGRRLKTICKAMHISPNTARNHLKSIFRKLGVHSQEALIELLQP